MDFVSKYVGKVVNVLEQKFVTSRGERTQYIDDPNDPVLSELKKECQDNGYSLRVWVPGIMGTCDWNTKRVNIDLVQQDDKSWKIIDPRLG